MHKTTVIVALFLSACAGESSKRLFTGLLEPVSGTCDPPAQAQLVTQGDTLVFVPNSGTLLLKGLRKGSIVTAAQRIPGTQGTQYLVKFDGALRGSEITGVYQTARCRYRVSLHEAAF